MGDRREVNWSKILTDSKRAATTKKRRGTCPLLNSQPLAPNINRVKVKMVATACTMTLYITSTEKARERPESRSLTPRLVSLPLQAAEHQRSHSGT